MTDTSFGAVSTGKVTAGGIIVEVIDHPGPHLASFCVDTF